MHVVLSGYFGFHNTGDEAILSSMIKQLRTLHPGIRITVLSDDLIHTTTTYGVESVSRWNFRDIRRVLQASDGLISGGGSLLQDATGPKSIVYYTAIMNMAMWLGKPVFVYAQGMGPFDQLIGKRLTSYTLNRVDGLTVRDEDSKHRVESLGVKQNCSVVPDAVFGYDAPSVQKKHQIAVSFRSWHGSELYIPKLAFACDQLAQQGFSIIFVPMHGQEDERFAKLVELQMTEPAVVTPGNDSIEEKLGLIAESELLIGMRLHALIFAAISHTPFLPLSYDPKIDSFAAMYELDNGWHVEGENWDGHLMFKEAQRMLDQRRRIGKQISSKTEILRSQALSTTEQALEVLKKK
ncbi:polysaccharide pyruvyl transferase CsaB [Halobacillus sp. K22]|uniref:polysaccharide pyruvyl transferase CsaB n=1 Tax=Halobacillus sp. K22 TaxID=3457431 RepID=UPI003FCE5F87